MPSPLPNDGVEADELHSRIEASAYLKRRKVQAAPQTLAKLAVTGGGPPFLRIGRMVFYTTAALDAFALERRAGPFRSTAQR